MVDLGLLDQVLEHVEELLLLEAVLLALDALLELRHLREDQGLHEQLVRHARRVLDSSHLRVT